MTTLQMQQIPGRSSLRDRLMRRPAFAPTAIGVLGFAISVLGNWIPSLWYDEAATVTSAARSWSQLWAEVQNVDAVHAVYYGIMHVVFSLVGYSPFTLRLPSAIAVGLTAAALVILVRKLRSGPTAAVAGVVFCLIPRVTWMGAEGRSYAISALLAVALTLVLLLASRSGGRHWWIAYGVLVFVSCLVFVYLALIVVAQGTTLIIRSAFDHNSTGDSSRPGSRLPLADWGRASGVAFVCLIPFLFVLQGQKSQLSLSGLSFDTVVQILGTQWFGNTLILPLVAWPVLIAGAVLLWRSRRGSDLARFVLSALILPMAVLLVVTAVWLPAYSTRYLSMCTPFVAVAMGVAIVALRTRMAIGAAIALLVALTIPHLVLVQRAPEAKQQSSWSEVAAKIGSERATQPVDDATGVIYGPLWHHDLATTRAIEYSYPAAFANTVDITLETPAADTANLWETHSTLDDSLFRLDGLDTVYLVTSVTHDTRPETTAALDSLGWHVDGRWTFTDVHVVRYEH